MSSELAPNSIAIAISAIISPACGPIICTPKTLSEVASASIFTKPSGSSIAFALEFAIKGNFPTLKLIFFSFNCSSVFPTEATSGVVKLHQV